MSHIQFSRRTATTEEIKSIGFKVENGMALSQNTGAWYDADNFQVSDSATIDGEQRFGKFISLNDDQPMAEFVLVEL